MLVRVVRPVFNLLLALALLAGLVRLTVAQADPVSDLLTRINALRTQSGLLPLAVSDKLTAAAQRHSTDMATYGFVDHTGSDGSTMDSRIRASGYGFWRNFGIWGENIYGGQTATVDDAWNFWINSQAHRSNLINTRYREIGVAFAASDKGTYFTLDFGAQPNVLPFFVTGTPPNVTLLLTNEDNITTGDGVTLMGQAVQMRIGEGTDLNSLPWVPWAASVPFTLSNAPGAHTLTVELRDELKRGTKMTRVVNVADLVATETVTPTTTATATTAATSTAQATATSAATTTATPQPTGTAAATTTPTPTATATPTTAATSTPAATATTEPTVAPAPLETSTPASTPTVQMITLQPPTSTAQAVAIVFPTSVSASRLTPPAPRPVPTERPLIALFDRAPSDALILICGLQAAVLTIGVVALAVRIISRRKA